MPQDVLALFKSSVMSPFSRRSLIVLFFLIVLFQYCIWLMLFFSSDAFFTTYHQVFLLGIASICAAVTTLTLGYRDWLLAHWPSRLRACLQNTKAFRAYWIRVILFLIATTLIKGAVNVFYCLFTGREILEGLYSPPWPQFYDRVLDNGIFVITMGLIMIPFFDFKKDHFSFHNKP